MLVKYVVSRINKVTLASDIIHDVEILKSIIWLKLSRSRVSQETLQYCFQTCVVKMKMTPISRRIHNTFYFLKTVGYTGVFPETFMSNSTQEVLVFIIVIIISINFILHR